ncbi:2800_t:CDS:2 [Cetraspora pellucida]|uniref:2800_t:CDS:1 n=1 Tax=Cetraspora pellucida TaxID=1433469 RepID=A0A9N9A819_9GLOM|nr:2800_t:CDS:2 [Cetraspora pellucida]
MLISQRPFNGHELASGLKSMKDLDYANEIKRQFLHADNELPIILSKQPDFFFYTLAKLLNIIENLNIALV